MKRSINTNNRPKNLSLNLAIVGGGKAYKSFLDLLKNEPFSYLNVTLVGVCDINPKAEGLQLAKEMGIYTTNDFRDLFKIEGLKVIVELTNSREVLIELILLKPKGVGVLDHNVGRFMEGLIGIDRRLRSAEQQVALERMAADFIIEQANERIAILSPDFKIIEVNEAYLNAAGRSKEAVIGAHCYEITHGLSAPCSSSQPEMGCPLLETLRTGESAGPGGSAEANGLGCRTRGRVRAAGPTGRPRTVQCTPDGPTHD